MITSLVLLLISGSILLAEDLSASASVFINSSPINAVIIFDDEPILQKTPALLKDVSAGGHSVKLIKEGFSDAEFTLQLEADTTAVEEIELSSGTVVTDFPDGEQIFLRTSRKPEEDLAVSSTFRLPEGELSFKKEDGRLIITPVYPKQQLLTLNTVAFFTALTANIIAGAAEIYYEKEYMFPHSTGLIIAESAAVITGVSELVFMIDKNSYMKDFLLHPADPGQLESAAVRLYEDSQQLLSRGRLQAALTGFTDLVSSYPDSSKFTEALYRIAKIHIISGDTNLAASELNIIINHYPQADIYDNACRTLAQLYYNDGKTEAAAEVVNSMVFYDPSFAETRSLLAESGAAAVLEFWTGNPEGGSQ